MSIKLSKILGGFLFSYLDSFPRRYPLTLLGGTLYPRSITQATVCECDWCNTNECVFKKISKNSVDAQKHR